MALQSWNNVPATPAHTFGPSGRAVPMTPFAAFGSFRTPTAEYPVIFGCGSRSFEVPATPAGFLEAPRTPVDALPSTPRLESGTPVGWPTAPSAPRQPSWLRGIFSTPGGGATSNTLAASSSSQRALPGAPGGGARPSTLGGVPSSWHAVPRTPGEGAMPEVPGAVAFSQRAYPSTPVPSTSGSRATPILLSGRSSSRGASSSTSGGRAAPTLLGGHSSLRGQVSSSPGGRSSPSTSGVRVPSLGAAPSTPRCLLSRGALDGADDRPTRRWYPQAVPSTPFALFFTQTTAAPTTPAAAFQPRRAPTTPIQAFAAPITPPGTPPGHWPRDWPTLHALSTPRNLRLERRDRSRSPHRGGHRERNTSSVGQCVVCMDGEAEYAIIPCGHQCLCSSCRIPSLSTCPICRQAVQSTLKIFCVARD